jgi:predicted esterase
MDNKQITPKGKILFLHGFTQNSEVFESRIKVILKQLKSINYDYIIPDGPHIVKNSEYTSEIQRAWFYLDETDRLAHGNFKLVDKITFLGLDESLDKVKEIILKEEITSIISFSQGCIISLILNAMKEENEFQEIFKNLKCVIHAAGYGIPYCDNYEKYVKYFTLDKQITLPSLHIYGKLDEFIEPYRSARLVEFYKDPEVYIHEGKHCVPSKKTDLEKIIQFLAKYH